MTTPFDRLSPADQRREIERRHAARQHGLPLAATWAEIDAARGGTAPAAAPEDEGALEYSTQRAVVKRFVALGGEVWVTSQNKRIKIRPGLPDVWVFFPVHGVGGWFETKRPVGGRYAPAQIAFRDWCRACRIPWGGGSVAAAEAWLIELGIAYRASTGELEATRPRVPTVPATPALQDAPDARSDAPRHRPARRGLARARARGGA